MHCNISVMAKQLKITTIGNKESNKLIARFAARKTNNAEVNGYL